LAKVEVATAPVPVVELHSDASRLRCRTPSQQHMRASRQRAVWAATVTDPWGMRSAVVLRSRRSSLVAAHTWGHCMNTRSWSCRIRCHSYTAHGLVGVCRVRKSHQILLYPVGCHQCCTLWRSRHRMREVHNCRLCPSHQLGRLSHPGKCRYHRRHRRRLFVHTYSLHCRWQHATTCTAHVSAEKTVLGGGPI